MGLHPPCHLVGVTEVHVYLRMTYHISKLMEHAFPYILDNKIYEFFFSMMLAHCYHPGSPSLMPKKSWVICANGEFHLDLGAHCHC